ncbi:hypothetical protein UA08_08663 [Talaromyces atroroseus]|uniref:chitinase n=1 Tax=Talaromyces atroroseus TaxID=1441469 RepID=A0A225ABF3_TALAT|nr:hypothetical protein UA08_08663 [Talaromyces atroroseus]OKL56103.1 hypothetical protein UA08_08663 [Talaromyces atroroseus]
MAFRNHAISLLLIFVFLAIDIVHASLPFSVPAAFDEYLSKHPISVKPRNETTFGPRESTLQQASTSPPKFSRTLCPVSCAEAGDDPSSWTVYHDLDRFSHCNQSMLVNFALHTPLEDDDTHISLYACASAVNSASAVDSEETDAKSCATAKHTTKRKSTLQLAWSGSNSAGSTTTDNAIAAVQQLQSYMQADNSCDEKITFAYSDKALVGLYAGAGLQSQNVTGPILEEFLSYIQSNGISGNLVAQSCASTYTSSRYSIGVALSTDADWTFVQEAVQAWSNASCVTAYDEATTWHAINYLAPVSSNHTSNSTSSSRHALQARDTCTTIRVASGDTCTTLAAECGITAAEFTEYNPSSGECSSLTPVAANDTCSVIAATYDITVSDIDNYNNDTWGWMGCSDLQLGARICLSSGYPPMPSTISNAVCGPQVNGTAVAPHGTNLSTLNECPLNACCDIWGQCGTTAEFCFVTESTTGAPGTAANGTNGCISNCGADIIYSDPPAEFLKIGYFEGYDWQRPCLAESILSVDTSKYTHIHLAFATLNADFSVNVSSMSSNFDDFGSLSGVKRILSFGGWEFSTSSSTYEIFRQAVQEANRATFISNVLEFLDENNLDGVDFDWEYPGEPDIPGIPADTTADVIDFYVFLGEFYESNAGKYSVSVTAPSSYWYLKNIPIYAMSAYVDYIVFMTYDLHGQWDYGSKFSDPGCPAGNCLRSDVNITETLNSLSMITKAGVPSNMVVVGVTSYGRSFKMTTPGCYTDMCTYTGPDSGATPGPCTDTAGYLGNGEIADIIAQNSSGMIQFVDESYSNILVYDEDQWVSYMDDENKEQRGELYSVLAMGGWVDWAIDLQNNGSTSYLDPGSSTNGSGTIYIDPSIWTNDTGTLDCIPPCSFIMPPLPLSTNTTVSIPPTSIVVVVSSPTPVSTTIGTTTTTLISYIPMSIPTVLNIPAYTGPSIPVWGVSVPSGSPYPTTIPMISSIQPTPFPVVITPVWGGTTNVSGGTVTTQTPMTYISGHYTYIGPSGTHIFGGSTTITGGTTGTPITTTFTPNPYPDTAQSTPDKTLNTRRTSFSKGKPKETTHKGSKGAGHACHSFCHPHCPYCPPDFGDTSDDGGSGGGGGDGGDDGSSTKSSDPSSTGSSKSTSSSSSSSSSGEYTVAAPAFITADRPITTVGSAALASMESDIASMWNAMFPVTTTATTGTASTGTATGAAGSGGSTSTATDSAGTGGSGGSGGSGTSSTPSTTAVSWPTITGSTVRTTGAYCFTEADGYTQFTLENAATASENFCKKKYRLKSGDATISYTTQFTEESYAIVVSGGWAPDQSGCGGSEETWDFTGDPSDNAVGVCMDQWMPDYCDSADLSTDLSYGGGYLVNDHHGCILFELYAYPISTT